MDLLKKDLIVSLSAFNEAKVIGNVIKDLKKAGFKHILVIDDCSKDNTYEICSKLGVEVVRHVINRGHGAATKTGIEYARRNGFNYVLLMDSDGQHDAKDALKLVKYAKKYDVVMGSRLVNLENMPFIRKFLNFGGSILTYFFFGLYVKDSQSGFKILNRKAMDKINITFDRYEFCSEVIGEIYRNHLTYKEIPIKVIYTNHSLAKGQSFSNSIKMIFKIIFKS